MKVVKAAALAALALVLAVPVVAAEKKPAKMALVDINSAPEAELKKIPGLEGYGGKIVSGRPYKTVEELDGKVLPPALFLKVRDRIVAGKKK